MSLSTHVPVYINILVTWTDIFLTLKKKYEYLFSSEVQVTVDLQNDNDKTIVCFTQVIDEVGVQRRALYVQRGIYDLTVY